MRRGLLLTLLVGAAACVSTGHLAPPVDDALVARGRAAGVDRATLAAGRRQVLRCAGSCHAPEPVASRSASAWTETLDQMIPRARLQPADAAALRAYLAAATAAAQPRR